MSSKSFDLEKLFGGFCPPTSYTAEDSDDESSYGKMNTRSLVSGVPNVDETKPSPPTTTTSTVASTSNSSMDPVYKVPNSPRRQILPTPIVSVPPPDKNDIPQLGDTPSSALESEGAPTPTSEKEISSIETINSVKETNNDVSNEVFERDAFAAASFVADTSAVVREDTDDKEEKTNRPSRNTLFFSWIVVVVAFFLYLFSNFSRADIESISLDSILDYGAININSKTNPILAEDPTRPAAVSGSESVMEPQGEEDIPQDGIDGDHRNPSAIESVMEPQGKETVAQGEIDGDHRTIDQDGESLLEEPEHADVESSPIEDNESADSAEDLSMSSEELREQVEISVDTVVEGEDINFDVEDKGQVDGIVEGDAVMEDAESNPLDVEPVPISAERSIESEDLNSDMVHQEQVDTSIEGNGVVDKHSDPDYGERGEKNADLDNDDQDSDSFLESEEQVLRSVDHDIEIEGQIPAHGEQTEAFEDLDLEHEVHINTMVEDDSFSHHENVEQDDTPLEPDAEIEVLDSDPECKEQAENNVEPDAAIEEMSSDPQEGDEVDLSVEHDVEVDNMESDLELDEQVDRTPKQYVEIDDVGMIAERHDAIKDTVSDLQVQHEDSETHTDLYQEVESTLLEIHENESVETELTLESEAGDGVDEEDNEFQAEEDKKLLNEDHSHATDSGLMPDSSDESIDINGQTEEEAEEKEDSAMQAELLESPSGDMGEMQDSDASESAVTSIDEEESLLSDEAKENDGGGITLGTGSTQKDSEPTKEKDVHNVVRVVSSPANNTIRIFKLRSDERGPYLVTCEAYLDPDTLNTSPEFVCSE